MLHSKKTFIICSVFLNIITHNALCMEKSEFTSHTERPEKETRTDRTDRNTYYDNMGLDIRYRRNLEIDAKQVADLQKDPNVLEGL